METDEIIKNLTELQVIVNKFSQSLYKKAGDNYSEQKKAKRMETYSVSIFYAVGLLEKGEL
jgi:hypothetical protein